MANMKVQSSSVPTAMGSLLQSSCYGNAIPVIYGRTQSPPLAIWANNLRRGGSNKKMKQKMKGITSYIEAIDFLLGTNPIMGVLMLWNNGSPIPLNFVEYSTQGTSLGTNAFTIPDPYFHAVIAVTLTQNYSVNFDDYGGGGPQTLSGSYEVPLWNSEFHGPDPTDGSDSRNYPYTYRWNHSYGPNVYIDNFPGGALASGMVNIYYAQTTDATGYQSPMLRTRLAFENVLGSGSEYDGYAGNLNMQTQQILYPHFAGMGSNDIDLGASGAIPQLGVEVQGKWGIYPSGDCDFADMIEDMIKSGISQAAVGGDQAFTQFEHGMSAADFPGTVQKKILGTYEDGSGALTFDLPNTAGNTLVVFADRDTAGPITVSDSQGNVYVPAAGASRYHGREESYGLFYCVNCKGGPNTVTFGGGGNYGNSFILLELAGIDTFDAVTVATGTQPQASITTSNAQGSPAVILAISLQQCPYSSPGQLQLWPVTVQPFWCGDHDGENFVQQRNVNSPGTFSLQWESPSTEGPYGYILLIAFKATQPLAYPKPVGSFLDMPSLNLMRAQCRAYGLWGSLTMTSQQTGQSWLKTLYQAANAAPVYMGFRLYSFPYAEASGVGNGAIYIAPTASGPVANLSTENGDFIASSGSSPITQTRKARVDLPNVVQMQHISRNSNYAQTLTVQPEASSIALYGVRKAAPITNNAVQDMGVARKLLAVQARTLAYAPDTYEFTLNAKWSLLAPMDLVTISDPDLGLEEFPVQITSIEEDDHFQLKCEAMPFIYGMRTPTELSVTQPTPYVPSTNQAPGDVNAPVIFEPVPRLYGSGAQGEIWAVVSASSAQYGGCQVAISTDGGNSYNVVGTIAGSAITGVTTADWPAASDPDTVDNLPVNLTESNGSLLSYQVSDEDNFVYPCYVAGGGSSSIPYELMTYASATLTGANSYTLNASGTGNHLRRAVFGAPALGAGCDHPAGSRFAFLNPSGQGIFKIAMDPLWIGKTLYFKFLAYNTFAGAGQSLADAVAYAYTPTGGSGSTSPNSQSYSQTPAIALSQPTPTAVDMAQIAVAFATNQANYNARSFTIPTPTAPTWYYVTIADPGYVGDTGAQTNLTATCQTSSALVGVAGNVYVGAILALPAGAATTITPGGQPTPQLFTVNGN
ncbi:MAG: phage tail protein [Acidobacteriaceae bacterium]